MSPRARTQLARVAAYASVLLAGAILLSVYRAPRVLFQKVELSLRSGRFDVTVYGAVWNARPSGIDWTPNRPPWMTWRVLPRLKNRTLELPLWPLFAATSASAAFLIGQQRGRRLRDPAGLAPGLTLIMTGLLLAVPLPDTTSQYSSGAFRIILNGGYAALGLDRSTTLNTSNFAGSPRLILWPRRFDAASLNLPPGSWAVWVPLWQLPLMSLLTGAWLHGRARGSRVRGVICPSCEYDLDAVPVDGDGNRTCPECGVTRTAGSA